VQLELPFDRPLPSRRKRKLPSERSPAALARLAGRLLGRLVVDPRRRSRAVAVVFNSRLRTAAGRADGRGWAIELNPRLLDRHPDELVPTLVHELCHLAVGVADGHGKRWRRAMLALGHPPTTCHRLDTSGLESQRRRAWRWRCAGCGETYLRRHRGARRFRCGSCGGRLRVDAELGGAPD
jgi:predicted SprT family Zn-dependent metalloprotease